MAQKMLASSLASQLQAHSQELNCFGPPPPSVLAILKGQHGALGGVWEWRNWKWKASKFCHREAGWQNWSFSWSRAPVQARSAYPIDKLLREVVLLSSISMFRPSSSTWDVSLFLFLLSWTRPNLGHLCVLLSFLCHIFSTHLSCHKVFLAATQWPFPMGSVQGAFMQENTLGAALALALTLHQAPHWVRQPG